MTTTTAPATARQFGRCPEKGCKTRIVLDPATDPRVVVGQRNGKTVSVTVDAPVRTDLGHNVIVGSHGMPFCGTKHGAGSLSGATHNRIEWASIKARKNDTIRCDAKCWNAKTADCECSCDGAFHGQHAL